MKISIQNIDSTIFDVSYIYSHTYNSYYHVSAEVFANIVINDISYSCSLQTGSFYEHNDYNMPTNSLTVYAEGSSQLIAKISYSAYDELDDEMTSEINESCKTNFTTEEICEIRDAINDFINDSQHIVLEEEQEAEKKLEEDNTTYVRVIPREKVEVDENVYENRQCGEDYLKSFGNREDANEFINSLDIDHAYVITKETARSHFPEDF